MNSHSCRTFRITAVIVACFGAAAFASTGDQIATIGLLVAIPYCLLISSNGLRATVFVTLGVFLSGFAAQGIGAISTNPSLYLTAEFFALVTRYVGIVVLVGLGVHAIVHHRKTEAEETADAAIAMDDHRADLNRHY